MVVLQSVGWNAKGEYISDIILREGEVLKTEGGADRPRHT